jgi:hypothetical protein
MNPSTLVPTNTEQLIELGIADVATFAEELLLIVESASSPTPAERDEAGRQQIAPAGRIRPDTAR